MVNWSKFSERLEYSWQKDNHYELPVPASKYDCHDLIDAVDELLGLFHSDDIYDDYECHVATGISLLEQVEPREVAISEYDEDWENELKLWLFANSIIHAIRAGDKKHQDFFIAVCQDYMTKLYDEYERLGGDLENMGGFKEAHNA